MKLECNAVGRVGGSSREYKLIGIGASTEGLGEGVPSRRGDLEVLRDGTPGRRASGLRRAGYSWVRGERDGSEVYSVVIELVDKGIW
jgi:hypothetical protein